MKKVILFSLLFIFVIFNWSLNPAMKQAEAVTQVILKSPADSSKVTESTPTFKWGVVKLPLEIIKKYHIVLARDYGLTDLVWDDSSTLHPTQSIVYDVDSLVQWETYFWSVRVQVDTIIKIDTSETGVIDTTFDRGLWWKFVKPRTFFYTTATLIEIPDNRPTIQEGIIWAAAGDTILVKPGVYYENLRFYKNSVVLASYFARDTTNIAIIDSTIIDGDSLTRKEENGSVIYFTSNVDSTSWVIGFTIRNGKGTRAEVGVEEKVNGGGIFCDLGSTPTIAYNVITQNHVPDDGGGIFCYSAAPNIFDNIITQNSAGGSGGAIQCYHSIKTKPSLSSSPPGGEGKKDGGIEVMPKPSFSSPRETEKTSPFSESNSKIKEDDLKNSLYPRDATEVFSAPSSDPLAKPAQNTPPVAVLTYYPVKSKYFEGDTIWLVGSESYDEDEGDSVDFYQYKGLRWQSCEKPDDWKNYSISGGTGQGITTVAIPVTAGMGGRYRFWLIVKDTHREEDTSDTLYLNLQRAPTADAVDTVGIAPGDTAWLDGSGSCDINPDDTTISYRWTQISGPVTVTLSDSLAISPYFETKDSAHYLGEYQFQLQVCDSFDCDVDIAVVMCSNRPVAVCPPDTFGFDVDDSIPLDGSGSWDPDEALGDYVKYFTWEGLSRTTCEGALPFSKTIETTEAITSFTPEKGGVYAFSLSVGDQYGIRSDTTCTFRISVQLGPEADAGPDTIVRPDVKVYLHGSACEVNWDQKDFLQYWWQQDTSGVPELPLFDSSNQQNPKARDVWFLPSKSGVYRFALRVTDPWGASNRPDDTIRVIVNELPQIDGITPDPDDTTYAEGDSVKLKVWAHDDTTDVRIFGDTLTYEWTVISWPESYQPTIIDPTEPTMKFVPLKHGTYEFEVVVHDTFSLNQYLSQYPPVEKGFNIDTVKITIDTTLAHPFIMGNLISSNTAGLKGGGINCSRSSPEIINNIFYKNKSNSSGGAICSQNASTPQIRNNVFFGNISSDSTGGAIADLKVELSPSASIGFKEKMVVAHNDFWNNAGGDLYQPPADVFGNIYVYPRLVDPEYGDFRLECSSPCIGAGEDSSDIGSLKHFQPCFNIDTLRMVSLSLFQNPIATAVAHFLVNTDVPLKAPPVAWVTIGGHSAVPIYFTNIFSTTYRGDFIFTSSGTARIIIFASSVLEQDTSITRNFAVQLIEAGKIGKLVSHDNRLGVLFPQGVAKGEIYATCIPVSDDPQYNFEDEDKVALGEAYHLGPLSDFKKELTLSFPLDGYDLSEKDKTLFSIYRYEKNGWEKQASFLDENSICAKVRKLGAYRLVYDAKQEHIAGIPKTYQLFQNYPNPFNPQTMIKYDLPKSGHVNITVYNILGQKVKTLMDEHQEVGHKSVNWNGKDGKEKDVASGIYFYKIKTVGFEKTKKM
ncbi:MAG: T9SS type A sorting domain-containing protein, partial [candidate division Zixibacteria bacterium]|nr:T9SS type A sorting domain-containing protein [candidate division Zixibacteria bacterium]